MLCFVWEGEHCMLFSPYWSLLALFYTIPLTLIRLAASYCLMYTYILQKSIWLGHLQKRRCTLWHGKCYVMLFICAGNNAGRQLAPISSSCWFVLVLLFSRFFFMLVVDPSVHFPTPASFAVLLSVPPSTFIKFCFSKSAQNANVCFFSSKVALKWLSKHLWLGWWLPLTQSMKWRG